MELLIIVLNKTEYLNEILEGFVDEGLKGATVIDSSGMGHIVGDHIPFFSQFAVFEEYSGNHSKTIFTVVESEERRNAAVKVIECIIGDITEPDTAFFFSVPVSFSKGHNKSETGDNK